MESQADLFVTASDVADPVATVVRTHRADHRAGHPVQLCLLGESALERLLYVVDLVKVHMPAFGHLKCIEFHLAGQVKPR